MKRNFLLKGIVSAALVLSSALASQTKTIQTIDVYTGKDATVTSQSIYLTLESKGLSVFGKEEKNNITSSVMMDEDLTYKLLGKYPRFGVLTPMPLVVWKTQDKKNVKVAVLNLKGMAQALQIKPDEASLNAYAKKIQTTLQLALPQVSSKSYTISLQKLTKPLLIEKTRKVVEKGEIKDEEFYEEFVEDYESFVENELEKAGFTIRALENVEEVLAKKYDKKGVYDFYQIYAISKPELTAQISKNDPAVGALSPFALYIYKLPNENFMHVGFFNMENWINFLNIKDKTSIDMVKETKKTLENIVASTLSSFQPH